MDAPPDSFVIHIEEDGFNALGAAIEGTPFSDALKRLLWFELLRLGRSSTSIDGLTYCADIVAGDAGHHVAHMKLGRAGEAMVAALRALAISAANKIGEGQASSPA